jgi:dynein heavy chain
MNPTAGSFCITPRMQRHFATFAVQMPSQDIIRWGGRGGVGPGCGARL